MKSKEPFYTTDIEKVMKPNFAFIGSNASINKGFSPMCIGGSIQAYRLSNLGFFSSKYNIITNSLFKPSFCGIKDKIQIQGHLVLSFHLQIKYSIFKGE